VSANAFGGLALVCPTTRAIAVFLDGRAGLFAATTSAPGLRNLDRRRPPAAPASRPAMRRSRRGTSKRAPFPHGGNATPGDVHLLSLVRWNALMSGERAVTRLPTSAWAADATPLPSPRLADCHRPSPLNAGGAEVTLAASCPESARQLRTTRGRRSRPRATRSDQGSHTSSRLRERVRRATRRLSRNASRADRDWCRRRGCCSSPLCGADDETAEALRSR